MGDVKSLPGQDLGPSNFGSLVTEMMANDPEGVAIVVFMHSDQTYVPAVRFTANTSARDIALACFYLQDLALGGEEAS